MNDTQTNLDSIEIIPLGGFGEIGMNCLAVKIGGEILIIDCGVLFPPEPRLGIETIYPKLDYLLEHRTEVVGLFATHGHEDHIAGIPFLLQQLDVPVFGGAYTIGLLKTRLSEFEGIPRVSLTTVSPDEPVQIGEFIVTPLSLPHSIVDNFGLIIDWGRHRIFHSSDFKLNATRREESRLLVQQLQRIRPVELMISDSTGALSEDDAGDETELQGAIESLVASAPGRVFVALFSSNITRIGNLLQVAQNCGRKLTMSGKSVLNHYAVGRDTGKISSFEGTVIPVHGAHHFKDSQLLVLMSGTQGEARSALGRLAAGKHTQFKACPTDTVILSSRFIPGNELAISQTVSSLMAQKVTVFHHSNHREIHVSGHGSRHEIKAAIEAVSPRALLPAHGTYEHLQAAATIARDAGVSNTLVACNGDVVTYAAGILQVTQLVPAGRIYTEKSLPVSETVLKERRRIGENGVYCIWVTASTIDSSGMGVRVHQQICGVIDAEQTKAVIPRMEAIVGEIVDTLGVDAPNLQQHIKIAARKFMRNNYGKNPVFLIDISTR